MFIEVETTVKADALNDDVMMPMKRAAVGSFILLIFMMCGNECTSIQRPVVVPYLVFVLYLSCIVRYL